MSVKLSGTLPKSEENNGTYLLTNALIKEPAQRHVLVMVVDCAKHSVEFDGEVSEVTPTMACLYVEPIREEEDVNDVVTILGRARAARLGRDELDFEEFGVGDPFESLAREVVDGIQREQSDKEEEQSDDR